MARRVFFHVGLPKTGTTYLQTILWDNRDELRRQGVLLPGFGSRQHLWASGVVREDPRLDRRGPDAKHAWAELTRQVNEWPETAVVSHEFFAGASQEQAARAMADLAGAEMHVVLTARDMLSLVTARWQEMVKNGSTVAIDDYPADGSTSPHDEWGWASMDTGEVLRRWGASLPPERVHVLTLPKPTEPKETLWLRFAELVGIDPARVDVSGSQRNESLGVVEVELLRRVNGDLTGFGSAFDRGVWIRGYLAQGKLVPRKGEKFWPSPERVEQLRRRGDHAVAQIETAGYDVIGDVGDLRTPATLPERRHPSSVGEAEMLAAATSTIAAMMTDVRRLTRQKNAAEARRTPAAVRTTVKKVARRARALWRRS
ncbi:MAG: hypothetical protein ACTHOK_05905 [Nocardioidaceae bacterium]